MAEEWIRQTLPGVSPASVVTAEHVRGYQEQGETAELWRLLLQIHRLTLQNNASITGENPQASICTCIRVLIEAAVAEARERNDLGTE